MEELHLIHDMRGSRGGIGGGGYKICIVKLSKIYASDTPPPKQTQLSFRPPPPEKCSGSVHAIKLYTITRIA